MTTTTDLTLTLTPEQAATLRLAIDHYGKHLEAERDDAKVLASHGNGFAIDRWGKCGDQLKQLVLVREQLAGGQHE